MATATLVIRFETEMNGVKHSFHQSIEYEADEPTGASRRQEYMRFLARCEEAVEEVKNEVAIAGDAASLAEAGDDD